MHTIEPFYNWRGLYIAAEDPNSPFYDREYSEFEFTDAIYNYVIHPQWDNIDSPSLFIKILFVDYETNFAVIELFGEWNDPINNDIMLLKRDIIEVLMQSGIHKFVLIAENLLNFHGDSDDYYEEWFEEVQDEDGWIALVNTRPHVLKEIQDYDLDYYFLLGGELEEVDWRTSTPDQFLNRMEEYIQKRIG
ncbi:hypothetical protein [Crocinitomix catalasitica]|uniref:hypothetical protein n=1 Tax=Crocinitomix catalasitica TaxID=184607 RepID=UPI0004813603|nr:hypothetical protein [Crocinitomix catalasitica]